MTDFYRMNIHEFRAAGYAVTVVSPKELEGVNPGAIEQSMIDQAYESIEILKDQE